MMECYAGFLSHTDHQIGRLITFLDEDWQVRKHTSCLYVLTTAQVQKACLLVFSMRYQSSIWNQKRIEQNLKRIDELGGTKCYNHYPVGWAMAGDTPFKWYKQYTHYGGTKDPFIVHWPKGIKDKGKIRTQFHHAIDIVPTILEAIGVEPPSQIGGYTQAPIEGVSMLYSFNDANAPTTKQIQYFEMLGNRGIMVQGLESSYVPWLDLPWENKPKWSFDEDKWELYNVEEEDFSECHDLAEKHPDKLRQLVEMWWAEAGKYNVLPLDDRKQERLLSREALKKEQTSYTLLSWYCKSSCS